MRIVLAITVVVAGLAAMVSGGAAQAQSGGHNLLNPTGEQSPVQPWERSLQRYYDRERMARQRAADPLAGLRTTGLDRREAMLRRFYGDPGRALEVDPARLLGLPANARLSDPATGAPLPALPGFAPTVSSLDIDGDGAVTRQEYFGARSRFFPAGPQSAPRVQRAQQRLVTQFRALDANRDGRVTPDEIAPYPGARF